MIPVESHRRGNARTANAAPHRSELKNIPRRGAAGVLIPLIAADVYAIEPPVERSVGVTSGVADEQNLDVIPDAARDDGGRQLDWASTVLGPDLSSSTGT